MNITEPVSLSNTIVNNLKLLKGMLHSNLNCASDAIDWPMISALHPAKKKKTKRKQRRLKSAPAVSFTEKNTNTQHDQGKLESTNMTNERKESKSELTELDLLKQINNNLQKLIKSNQNVQYTMLNIAYQFMDGQDYEVAESLHTTIRNGDQHNYINELDEWY